MISSSAFQIKYIISICKGGGILRKSVLQASMALTEKPPEIIFEEDLTKAINIVKNRSSIALIFDWELGMIRERTAFLQRFRRIPACKSSPIIFVSSEISKQLNAISQEYGPFKIVSLKHIEQSLPTTLRTLFAEIRNPNQLLITYTELQDAILQNNSEQIENLVLELYDNYEHETFVRLEYANHCFRNNNLAEAFRIAKDVLENNRDDTVAMTLLGKIYLKQKKIKEAFAHLTNANTLSPDNVERLCLLGEIYREAGRYEDSQKYFQASLVVDSQCKEARTGLVVTLLVSHKIKEGIICAQDHLNEEDFGGIFNRAAIIVSKLGKHEYSIQLYEEALLKIAKSQSRARILFNLALSCMKIKRLEDAKKHLMQVLTIDPGLEKAQKYLDDIEKVLSPHKRSLRVNAVATHSHMQPSGLPPPVYFDHEEEP